MVLKFPFSTYNVHVDLWINFFLVLEFMRLTLG